MQDVLIDRASAEAVVERVRPAIRADGGDIEVIGVVGSDLFVRLHGSCIGCPSSEKTLKEGLEARLRSAIPGFGRVVATH